MPLRGSPLALGADAATLPAPGGAVALDRLARGTQIGRYLVVDLLGEGGMGVVYAAYDPELDRRIAVKVLRLDEGDGTSGRARMQREAQALARLTHPNVIAIHDVGAIGDGLFLAMELASGGTLRSWQPGRPWREVLRAYVAAGRGLAAAHDAGLVHRDFKPENVLLGHDGRVRVTDFGLVRAADPGAAAAAPGAPLEGELGAAQRSPGGALTSALTQAGAVMGTPHYMAPEQLAGGEADARSDQFALCVAGWEALFGERPYAGDDLIVLRGLIEAEERRPPPAGTAVPARVIDALARGLAAAPAARWPSVAALLDELEVAATPPAVAAVAGARGPWLGLVVALGAGAAVAGFATGLGDDARLAPCADAAAPADALWSGAARADVRAAFDASGAPWAADAFVAFDGEVTRWRDRWRRAAVATCSRAASVPAVTALRERCLGAQRARVMGVVAGLGAHGAVGARLDADAVARLADAARLLPEVAACEDTVALAGRAPPPPSGDAEIAAVRAELAAHAPALMALDAAGAQRALPAADALVARARALGWAPLLGEALYFRGELGELAADVAGGRAALFEAVTVALASRDDELAARAMRRLATFERQAASALADAERWIDLAAAATARLASPAHARLDVQFERARILRAASRLPEARAALEEVLRGYTALVGPDAGETLSTLDVLAAVATDEGEYGRAQDYLDRALPVARARLGDHHPRTAAMIHTAGNVAYWRGDLDRARALLTEAVAIRRAAPGQALELSAAVGALGSIELARGQLEVATAHLEESLAIVEHELGPDHPEAATAISEQGGARHQLGDHAGALALNRRALAIRERALGPEHPDVAVSLVNIAVESKALGRMDEVEPAYLRALAIFEAGRGAANPTTGITWLNLAEYYRVVGRLDAAAGGYAKARAILVPVFGDDHIVIAHVLNGEGQLALARGGAANAATAVAALERAVAMRAADGSDIDALAESRFALARALIAARGDAARATLLATQARDGWASMGEPGAAAQAKVAAWLKAR